MKIFFDLIINSFRQLTNYMKASITTAPTKFIKVGDVQFTYRRFGLQGGIPLLFLQHFTGTMDTWDPLVADGIAEQHDVIVFNNRGVGSSEGITPSAVSDMKEDVLAFMHAIGLTKVNILAYSLGGFIGQLLLKENPGLIGKMVLVGTGPKGGKDMNNFRKFVEHAFSLTGLEIYLFIFYTTSEKSRASGMEVFNRLQTRTKERDPDSSNATVFAQTQAIEDWAIADKKENDFLANVVHPVLIVNGSNDAMFDTINSYELFTMLPNAQLCLYPDSAHGALFQHSSLFVEQVNYFLEN